MNILLLGSSGFLGSHIKRELTCKGLHNLIAPSRSQLFAKKNNHSYEIESYLNNSDIVINCIADTNFESCKVSEDNFANIRVPEIINKFCNPNSYKIHFSTDAMYDSGINLSKEISVSKITNAYVKQKLNSETFFLKNSVILRTSFVGLNPRNNGMVNYLIDSFSNQRSIKGWSDVYTSSVHVDHICSLVLKLIEEKPTGTFNYGVNESYSKYSFLSEICKSFKKELFLEKISSPLAEDRNKNCGMCSEKIVKALGIKLPSFEDVVNESIRDIRLCVK